MQNIAIIKQGTGRYLFSVPESVTLREGDRVKCDTRRGITDGIAFADSAWVDENVSQLIGKLVGAKFPLKPVVGKMEYQPFEKPEEKPANKYEGMSNKELANEMCCRGSCYARNSRRRKHDCLFADDCDHTDVTDANRADVIKYLIAEDAEAEPDPESKPEPIKLYCVKDYKPGEWVTNGKIYEVGADGKIKFDDGYSTSYAGMPKPNSITDPLVPLVKRPAKVGEWVLLDRDDCFRKNKKGDIAKVVDGPFLARDSCFISDPTREYSGGICVCFELDYSYVLDGYKPEPEADPEPKYWSGKVVCIKADEFFTAGKVYEFRDGLIKSNTGNFYNGDSPIESFDDLSDGTWVPKFIEFKGEAHD